MKSKFEILAPAGSYEILKAVVAAGADAVYVGGTMFGARAYANNFSDEELLMAIDYCHLRNVKLYMTVNTLMKGLELEKELIPYLIPFYERGLDAVIVQDIGALTVIHKAFPDLELHASTQMTVHGVEGALLMKELGCSRVVTSREMNLEEIKAIHDAMDIEIETFVHGALCYSFSGQCLFSSMLGGRSGNRGRCAQPCRLPYSVLDEKNKLIEKDTYILSLKDNCALNFMEEMANAGIYSLKIEGRMKQAEYAAGVVSYYRKYVDAYENGKSAKVSKEDANAVKNLGNRSGFTNRYFTDHNGSDMITKEKPSHEKGDEALQARIRKDYIEADKQLPLSGFVTAFVGAPLTYSLTYKDITVTLEGQEVMSAEKRPICKEDIAKAMGKLGDDNFIMEDLWVELDQGAFLPVNAMKSLRREALDKLKKTLICQWQREVVVFNQDMFEAYHKVNTNEKEKYIVSCENPALLDLICREEMITTIYLDGNIYSKEDFINQIKADLSLIRHQGKEAGFMLPSLFRMETSAFYSSVAEELDGLGFDYVILRSYEEAYWAREHIHGSKLIFDHNLYAYNNTAEKALHHIGAEYTTIPLELNQKEIRHHNNELAEMIIYGRYPLMTTANCVTKNTIGCQRQPGLKYLEDRYQKKFPVKNYCNHCFNIIYNSLPTNLMEQIGELKSMNISRYRLHITNESPKEVDEVFRNLRGQGKVSFETTKGHYKRGVE